MELVRQLKIVAIRDPKLAYSVQVVNVILQDYLFERVLLELVRCLLLLSNLHTLQILGIGWCTKTINKTSTFPQMRTFVAFSHGHGILASFPNLKNDLVTIKDSGYLLSTLSQRNLYWKFFRRKLRRRLHFYPATCFMHWLTHLLSRCRKALELEGITFDVINPSFTPGMSQFRFILPLYPRPRHRPQ